MKDKASGFIDDILNKVKSSVSQVLREVADSIEEQVTLKWLVIALAVLFFWKRHK